MAIYEDTRHVDFRPPRRLQCRRAPPAITQSGPTCSATTNLLRAAAGLPAAVDTRLRCSVSRAPCTPSPTAVRMPARRSPPASLEGTTIKCRAHGLRFDVATGCPRGAGGFALRTYPVRVHDGRVEVDLGASAG